MTDADRLRDAIRREHCPRCHGSGVGTTPHPRTGRCASCRGSGRSTARAFAAAGPMAFRPSYRTLQRWLAGTKPMPAAVIRWLTDYNKD